MILTTATLGFTRTGFSQAPGRKEVRVPAQLHSGELYARGKRASGSQSLLACRMGEEPLGCGDVLRRKSCSSAVSNQSGPCTQVHPVLAMPLGNCVGVPRCMK